MDTKGISYIDRLEQEKNDIEVKATKLDMFMSRRRDMLSDWEKILMYHQKKVMDEYVSVLRERIELAKIKEEM